jgi:peroxin-13
METRPPPIPPRTIGRTTSSGFGGYPGYVNPTASPWTTMNSYPNFANGYGASGGSFLGGAAPSYGYPGGGYGGAYGTTPAGPLPGARNAFDTIESVVHAVSSVSMLLESTYSALLASVRSVMAVGEQVSRMKSQMGHLYAALAFTRFLRWFQTNCGWIIGHQATPDLIWTNSSLGANNVTSRPSQWPLLVYMAFLIGAPYMTWKFVQSTKITDEEASLEDWKKGQGDHFVAKAEFSFESQDPEELVIKAGQSLNLAPKELQPSGRGWLLASTVDGMRSGLVPANRIKILGRKILSTTRNSPQNHQVDNNTSPNFEDMFNS